MFQVKAVRDEAARREAALQAALDEARALAGAGGGAGRYVLGIQREARHMRRVCAGHGSERCACTSFVLTGRINWGTLLCCWERLPY